MKPGQLVTGGVIVLLAAALAFQSCEVGRARRAAWQADTTARNTRARLATTQQHLVRLDGQVTSVASRLATQEDVGRALEADTGRLARALRTAVGDRTAALALVQLLGDSLHRLQLGVALASGDTIRATDSLDARDSAGVVVRAAVTVVGAEATRPPPLPASWSWELERAPLALGVTFSCQGRDAVLSVTGPAWAVWQVDRAAQDASFCNPAPRFWRPLDFRPPGLPWSAILVGAGYAACKMLR